MTLSKFEISALLCCCACAVLIGCNRGPKMVDITGTVTVAGEPIEVGAITFHPADGQGQSDGAKIQNGKFTARVAVGEKRVQCLGAKIVGKCVPDELYPDREANEYEDFPPQVFTEEIKVTIEKKNQVVDIQYSGEVDVKAQAAGPAGVTTATVPK